MALVRQRVREAMVSAGFGTTSLAKASGLSPGYVNDVLSGRKRISVGAAAKIGPRLGIAARELIACQADEQLAALQAKAVESRSAEAA